MTPSGTGTFLPLQYTITSFRLEPSVYLPSLINAEISLLNSNESHSYFNLFHLPHETLRGSAAFHVPAMKQCYQLTGDLGLFHLQHLIILANFEYELFLF